MAPLENISSHTVHIEEPARSYGLPVLRGWRLSVAVFALALGLFLSALETTIIATALVTISSDLGHFEKANWIVVAYFLTYTGFLIIFARLSDIFGRKYCLLLALGFFTVWSLACGFAPTIEQLIVFRALQGIGGSGIYALAMTSITEITPLEQFGLASGAVSAIMACSSILGPIFGGLITSHGSWRWVFWLNIPAGSFAIVLVIWIFPQNVGQQKYSHQLYRQIDWPGVVMSLAASVLLTFALEEGGVEFAWRSGAIIGSFIVSGISWICFMFWEAFLTVKESKMLPIFPATLVKHRVVGASLLSAFFTGFPFVVTIINLPQRFQIVNDLSPVDAGIRMLPLLLLSAVGAGLTGFICSKKNIACYLLILSNALQILGTGLLSSLPVSGNIQSAQYAYQVILGIAFGMGLTSLLIISRVEVLSDDLAVTMGAITQVRILGGVIGLAIAQAAQISYVRNGLSTLGLLTSQQIEAILSSTENIALLPLETAQASRAVYGEAANLQMKIVMGFAAASLISSLWTWRRYAIEFEEVAKGRPEAHPVGSRP